MQRDFNSNCYTATKVHCFWCMNAFPLCFYLTSLTQQQIGHYISLFSEHTVWKVYSLPGSYAVVGGFKSPSVQHVKGLVFSQFLFLT